MINVALAIGHNYAKNKSGIQDRGSYANGAAEADVAKAVVDGLIKRGIPGFNLVKVPEGLSIVQRNAWTNARAKNLHAYLEFHMNAAADPLATGVETFYVAGNDWAMGEARQFQMAYTRVTGLKGRGVKGDTVSAHKRLGAIRDNRIFSLLVELGFVTNVADLAVVKKKAVEAAAAGIAEMFAS